MAVIAPVPAPKNEFFTEIEQLQNQFNREENKIWIDASKEYKKLKEKKSKTQ